MKIAKRILKWIAIAIALIAGVNFGPTLFFHFYRPFPALAAGLPSGHSNAEAIAEFSTRLGQKFPVGSKDADLIPELDREGWGQVYTDTYKQALRPNSGRPDQFVRFQRHFSLMFVEVATIVWKSDEAGNLTEIRGGYFRDVFFKQGG